jgi:SAM-dependent methyltransferase
LEDAFRRAGVERGAVLVDAGCGTGTYACGLAAGGFEVIAVDRSAELVVEARARTRGDRLDVEFVCADFTAGWAPGRGVDGVLCRGVLNDLLSDGERTRAFEAFGSWLRPGGLLLVDVRDRASSVQRYSGGRRLERTVRRGDDVLVFVSTTTMDPGSDLLHVVEHWSGTVGGAAVDEQNRFTMRCWTWEGLQELARRRLRSGRRPRGRRARRARRPTGRSRAPLTRSVAAPVRHHRSLLLSPEAVA